MIAALVLAAFPLVTGSAASGRRPVVLQPATHRSADGRFELFVDPSQRHGEGAGRYRLSHAGELLWAAELPFTFFDACVTDAGEAVGYAYSEGLAEAGNLDLVLLDTTGAVRWRDTLVRKTHRLHPHPNPWFRGIYLDEARGCFVVREADPAAGRDELWKCRSLTTGEFQRRFDLHDTMEDPDLAHFSTFAARVPDTELVLSHWDMWKGGRGGRFCLSNASDEVVWQLDRPGDYARSDERWRRALDGGAVLGVGPGPAFALWFASSDERVEFEVVRDVQGEWQVVERARSPWIPPFEAPSPALSELALETLASIPLLDGTGARVTPTAAAFRASGEVLVTDARLLRVYEPDGALLSEVRLQWWNWLGETTPSKVGALDDERIFVTYSTGQRVVFDPDGTCVKVLGARKGADVDLETRMWWFSSEQALLRDSQGKEEVRLERDALGRWLEGLRWPTSANDDRILLVSAEGWDEILSLYDAEGRPLHLVHMPREVKLRDHCADWYGDRIAAVTEANSILFYSDDGSAIGAARLTGDPPIVDLGFSPDGRELLVVDASGTLVRCATP